MMQKNNGTNACASCKHQRKKCTDKCILAPLFPVEKTKEFQAVHRVFGVSNLTKIVGNLPRDDDRRRAVQSLIWEASWRLRDPILGPYGEYKRIYDELKLYKNQFQCGNMYQNNVSSQGGVTTTMYKPHAATTGDLGGWNNNIIGDVNNTLDYIHEHGSAINADNNFYDYFTQREDEFNLEKVRRDAMIMNNECANVLPQHQHPANINGSNH
ncbi:hypothetical protein LIER_00744 [Lithospermum erythrorhizon]|uniref:LOB domain-containing protein n=1 Tax=Lithospermum erythrorhizon TaxID=34254 RepID=A0AAV3NIJ9_LITER